jgi:hypothetical protein
LDQTLRDAGFSGIEALSYGDHEASPVAVTMLSKKSVKVQTSDAVNLVYIYEIDPWIAGVATLLSKSGRVVTWVNFAQANTFAGDTIFFLDQHKPFFHDISPDNFERIRGILSDTGDAKILWVSRATSMSCEDPYYSMVHGVARSLRRELMLKFATVEVDHFDEKALSAVVGVYDKLFQQRSESAMADFEFSVNDGMVEIPRFTWKSLSQELSAVPGEDGPRKLTMTSPGIVDTMEWAPTPPSRLEGDEVELDMKYIGLNFRVSLPPAGIYLWSISANQIL